MPGFVDLFSRISLIEEVDTAHMGIAMCIAGCAPAFTDMYLEALGDAGVKYGLQRATAYRLAAKMIEGVGALCLDSGVHPGAMKMRCVRLAAPPSRVSPNSRTVRSVVRLSVRSMPSSRAESFSSVFRTNAVTPVRERIHAAAPAFRVDVQNR